MTKRLSVGIDEAGYGPTLGPLLLASSAFLLPEPVDNLWDYFGDVVRKQAKGRELSVWVDDSKKIKKLKSGMEQLECGVLAFHQLSHEVPKTLGRLLEDIHVDTGFVEGLPWYESLLEQKIPNFGWAGMVADKSRRLRERFEGLGVQFLGFHARPVCPREFNKIVDRTDNKGQVHFQALRSLIERAVKREPLTAALSIQCDKIGGRDRYGPLIGRIFPRTSMRIVTEGAKSSHYDVEWKARPFEIGFAQKADARHLPVALSSMLCKYLRELFMEHLNQHFQKLKPGLKKTAGYPADAKRFLSEIEDLMPDLGAPTEALIRSR